jgi:hypothetical protein
MSLISVGDEIEALPSMQVKYCSATPAATSGGKGGSQAVRARVVLQRIETLARTLDNLIYISIQYVVNK